MLKVQIEPRITAGISAGPSSGMVMRENEVKRLAPSTAAAS